MKRRTHVERVRSVLQHLAIKVLLTKTFLAYTDLIGCAKKYFLAQPIRSVYANNCVEIVLNPTVPESTFWHSQSDRCMPKTM